MAKLGCTCGHTIRDNTDCLPYKASCYADEDTSVYFEAIETVADLLEAYEQEAREHPLAPSDSRASSDRSQITRQITSILTYYRAGRHRTLYECENCGRLWLQVDPRENTYVSYLPEEQTRGVLQSHGGREEIPKRAIEKNSAGQIILTRAHALDEPEK